LVYGLIIVLATPAEIVMLMQVGIYERNRPKKKQKTKKNGKGKEWLLKKKEQMRRKGHDVPADTKYTGRKRKTYF
jgi:18S rRNA (guanine1575-N7)-methyltransferase